MRAVIQRVSRASVRVDGELRGSIGTGLLILVGIEENDSPNDSSWLAKKISNLRIFGDGEGKMNLSVRDVAGHVLVVSQFTLHADVKKGNRPSFNRSARPETAIPLYQHFLGKIEEEVGKPAETGDFGGLMDVELVNKGPVTIIIDTGELRL